MHKTHAISLGNLVFSLEEDAYKKLDHYLSQIKKIFADNPDKDEIIADIENSIADTFTKKLSKSKQVITVSDVNKVIKDMGDIKDFQDNEAVSTPPHEAIATQKKLFRDSDNQVIAGVCAGLAAYFNIDVRWIRLLFGLLVFTPVSGLIIIAYFILWLSIPEAKTIVEKMQMKGESATLSTIESSIKERNISADTNKESAFSQILLAPFRISARVLEFAGPILLYIIGIMTIFVSTVLSIGATAATGAFLFFKDSPSIQTPLAHFPATLLEYVLVVIIYLAVLVPLIYLIFLGISIMKRKYVLSQSVTLGLLGAWIIIVSAGVVTTIGLPGLSQKFIVSQQITKNVPTATFKNIEVNGAYIVKIVPGPYQFVTIRGSADEVNRTGITTANDGTLKIQRKEPVEFCLLCRHDDITIEITTPDIRKVRLFGATETEMNGFSSLNSLDISLFGASEMRVNDLDVKQLNVDLQGSTELTLQGKADTLSATMMGATEFNAFGLETKTARLAATGTSEVTVSVSDFLKVDSSGPAEIRYRGNPKTDINTKGLGEVTKVE